jgi:hypothetical protein
VPDAAITVSSATGLKRQATTNFHSAAIAAESMRWKPNTGFSTVIQGIELPVAAQVTQDVTLQVQAFVKFVSVTAGATFSDEQRPRGNCQ